MRSPLVRSLLCLIAGALASGVPLGLRLARGNAPAAAPAAVRQHCPMHPGHVSERPGDCPICGMRLVPIGAAPAAPAALEGRAAVTLSPERRRLMGLRSESVRRVALARSLRVPGRVTPDERRVQRVQAPFEGMLDALRVDAAGRFVQRGERLATLHSPQLVAAQEEFQVAQRAAQRLGRSSLPEIRRGGQELLAAARRRLRFWGLTTQDIAELEKSGMGRPALDLRAPVSGVVLSKNALPGQRVTPQDALFDIADLERVWVVAEVSEADLALVRVGLRAEVQASPLPGRRWRGLVTSVAPAVTAAARTLQVRLELENPGAALRPEMLVDVELRASGGHGLVVPESAVVRTGERELVFVEAEDGRLEPREVRVGQRLGAQVETLSGVRPGERVVVAAGFLLDSEASVRALIDAR